MNAVSVQPISEAQVQAMLQRVRPRVDPKDYELIELLAGTVQNLLQLLEDKGLSLARLRRVLFGPSTEKTAQVLDAGTETIATDPPETDRSSRGGPGADATPAEPDRAGRKAKGHGRNGVDEYPGAERIAVPCAELSFGCACPACRKGKVYTLPPSGDLRLTASPLVLARIYELERWRCNLCGEVFTATLPPETGDRKYDPTVGSLIALLKYGAGMPFHRLERLQESLGVPLPASTQWEIVHEVADAARPVLDALIHEAAQADVLHNDDTHMTILALEPSIPQEDDLDAPPRAPDPRTGVFTSGIVARTAQRTIALYFTGQEHAGQRLAQVLAQRDSQAAPPIQMCDGLSRNRPGDRETILANCLAHGRRQFVEIAPNFPDACRTVLESLRDVYRNDALAQQRGLSPEARLAFHRDQSGPIMDRLHQWLEAQFAEKRVEPNSALGKAFAYLLSRWEPLTLFLRQPDAPLDNNICERLLKMAILHRKNAYFFKTPNGAWVGDLFMSLIHTCRLCGANPFDYLTQLQKHADDVAENPSQWLPWNYRETPKPRPADPPPVDTG